MEEDIEIVWNVILDYDTTGGKNYVIDLLTTCVVMDGASTITLLPTVRYDGMYCNRIQVCFRGKDDTRFNRTRYIDDFFNTISRPITLTSEQVLNLVALHGL